MNPIRQIRRIAGVLAGAGYAIQAVTGAVLVVAAHLLLRPVARRIDKMPAGSETEVETLYRFRAICRSADEAHIRALAVQASKVWYAEVTAARRRARSAASRARAAAASASSRST